MLKNWEFFVNSIDIIFSNEYESHSQQTSKPIKRFLHSIENLCEINDINKYRVIRWFHEIFARGIKKRLCGFSSFLELLRQKLDRTKSIKMLSLSSNFLALFFDHQPRYFICKNCWHFGIHLPTQNVDCNTKFSPFL